MSRTRTRTAGFPNGNPDCGPAVSSFDDKLTEFSVIGLDAGIIIFLNGLRILFRYRALARTRDPRPKDSDDRNMIVKGQKEPMFLISFRNKGEEVTICAQTHCIRSSEGGGLPWFAC